MKINFSNLQKRVIFLDCHTEPDLLGGLTRNRFEMCKVWADVKPIAYTPQSGQYVKTHHVRYRLTVRYNPQIKRTMHIKLDNKLFCIESIMNAQGKGDYQMIYAIEEL